MPRRQLSKLKHAGTPPAANAQPAAPTTVRYVRNSSEGRAARNDIEHIRLGWTNLARYDGRSIARATLDLCSQKHQAAASDLARLPLLAPTSALRSPTA